MTKTLPEATPREPSSYAIQLAAQAWCEPATSHLEMVPELAVAFARILERELLSKGGGVPRKPTEEMLNAARDWSLKKYGKPVGHDGTQGCWKAMYDAAPSSPDDDALERALRELVRLKDLKDAIESDQAAGRLVVGLDYYNARKPLAWEAARAALKSPR